MPGSATDTEPVATFDQKVDAWIVDDAEACKALLVHDSLVPPPYAELYAELTAMFSGRLATRLMAEVTPGTYQRRVISPSALFFTDPGFPTKDKTLVLAFAGRQQRLMIPNVLFLQGLSAKHYDIVVLSDPSQHHFKKGCPGYADSFMGLVNALERDMPRANYRRTVAFGVSMGGLPAIRYALVTGVERGICVGARASWDIYRLLIGDAPPHFYDPICACSKLDHPGLVFVYGADNEKDRDQARDFSKLLGAQTVEVPEVSSHNILATMLESRTLGPFLDQLFRAKAARFAWSVAHG